MARASPWLASGRHGSCSGTEAAWEFSVAASDGGGPVDITRPMVPTAANTCLKVLRTDGMDDLPQG
jgi:hypothetical protein